MADIHFLVTAVLFHLHTTTCTSALNVALNKSVTLSSTAPYWNRGASLAVDGNKDSDFYTGSCVATAIQKDPWLMIDLGKSHVIRSVTVYPLITDLMYIFLGYKEIDNRDSYAYRKSDGSLMTIEECANTCRSDTQCQQAVRLNHLYDKANCWRMGVRSKTPHDQQQYIEKMDKTLQNLFISVGETESDPFTICVNHQAAIHERTTFTCTAPVRGRYIRLRVTGDKQILKLCEVEVDAVSIEITDQKSASDSVTLQWSACDFGADDGGVSDTFKLQYKRTQGSHEWTSNDVSKTSYTLQGLRHNTEYTFLISCYQNKGSEKHLTNINTEITVKTACQNPERVTGSSINAQSVLAGSAENPLITLRVSWQAMADSDSGCDSIKHYIVRYRKREATVWSASGAITSEKHAIQGLLTYMAYVIQIVAYNNADLISESDVKEIQTAEGWSSVVTSVEHRSSSDSMFVTWQAPLRPHGVITHYTVSYKLTQRLACGKTETSAWSAGDTITSPMHTIQNLKPYSQYVVRIVPVNGAGEGVPHSLDASTTSKSPSKPPTDLSISSKSAKSFMLTWQSTPCEQMNGRFVGHNVTVTGTDYDTLVFSFFQQNAAAQYTASGLVAHAQYAVRVAVVNDAGKSDSAVMRVRLDEAAPPAVTSLRILSSGVSSLVIGWTAPYPPHGVLLNYEIQLWLTGNKSHYINKNTTDNKTLVSVTGLRNVQNYSIQVRAINNAGWSEWSYVITAVTEEGVPEQPPVLEVTSRSSTSLVFQWQKPKITNGKITRYKMTCTDGSGKDHVVETDAATVTIDGLQAGRSYLCAVAAKTSKGYSAQAQIRVWTKPQKPQNLVEPELLSRSTTDTTVTISLPADTQNTGITSYQVVVDKVGRAAFSVTRKRDVLEKSFRQLAGCSGDVSRDDVYITAELPPNTQQSTFTVGDNKMYGAYINCPLQTGASYEIFYGAITRTKGGDQEFSFVKMSGPVIVKQIQLPPPPSSANVGLTVGIAVCVIAILICATVAAILIYRRHLKRDGEKKGEFDELDDINKAADEDTDGDSVVREEDTEIYANRVQYQNVPIPLKALSQHIAQLSANDNAAYEFEYQSVAKILTENKTVGSRPENKLKNRFANHMAYDHSRVVLQLLDGDPSSDYINACYINGYSSPAKFIASQGPTKVMIGDFWRMLWEQNIKRVVMLTNVMEKGIRKCEKYWPERGETVAYGGVTIALHEETVLSDFTHRTLRMNKGEESKTVWQFHYTVWPDHGVPQQAASLLNFMRKVKSYDSISTCPIVVHCSAGVGRTGTFIAMDYLLEEARVKQHLNFRSCLESLRQQRVCMIQTLDQYIFVHKAVCEALETGDTAYTAQEFEQKYAELIKVDESTETTELAQQFQSLCKMRRKQVAGETRDALSTENAEKNRSVDILPGANSRPFLSTMVGTGNNYINAVFIDGYKEQCAYIVTQMPLPGTITDFWRLIYEHRTNTVIMLNQIDSADDSCQTYWPVDQTEPLDFGPLVIELIETKTFQDFKILSIKLNFKDKFTEATRIIKMFQFLSWPNGAAIPLSTAVVISLLDHVLQWQQQTENTRVTVHCLDGASMSGLLLVASYVLEKLKLEQEIDIFNACRQIQVNRPQLCNSLEQYRFCHDLVLDYLKSMDTYANFQ